VSPVERLIPAKNGSALASYYLGLFSLFPVFGLVLAIAAVILGWQGLKNYHKNPAVRGRTHAWVGLICGVVFGLFNLLIVAVIVFGLITAAASSANRPA